MKLPVSSDSLWYKDGLAFTCTQCGNCCTGGPGYVWLSDAEIDRFASMVEAHTGTPILLKIAAPVEAQYELSAAIQRPLWSMRNFIPPNYAARPWRMWQASDMRHIDGVTGPVRWNVVAP